MVVSIVAREVSEETLPLLTACISCPALYLLRTVETHIMGSRLFRRTFWRSHPNIPL